MTLAVVLPTKTLLITGSILLITMLQSSAQTRTFTFKNCSLYEALQTLKEQGFRLAHNTSLPRKYHIDSLTISGNTQEEMLTQLFKGFPFGFERSQEFNQINVFPDPVKLRTPIRGQVINEENEPLAGANLLPGQLPAVEADQHGRFQFITAKDSLRISVTMVGYQPREFWMVNGKSNRITMQRQYGELPVTQKIGLFPGDPVRSPAEAIQAKGGTDEGALNKIQDMLSDETGLLVRRPSGSPARAPQYEMQGYYLVNNSNTHRNSVDPQFLLEGISRFDPLQSRLLKTTDVDSWTTLFNNDIETVEALRDAAATSPYGAHGANGMVVTTLKKASYKKAPTLQLSIFQGVSWNTGLLKLLDTDRYLEMRYAAHQYAKAPLVDYDVTRWGNNRNTNFPRAIFGGITGKTMAHLSRSWRLQRLSAYHSIGFSRERYPLSAKSVNQLYSAYTNIDYLAGRVKINLSLLGGLGTTSLPYLDPRPSQYFSPNAPIEKQNGLLVTTDSAGTALNPFGWQYSKNQASGRNLLSGLLVNWHPAKRLDLSLRVGWARQQTNEKAAVPIAAQPAAADGKAFAYFSASQQRTFVISPHADYWVPLGDGKLQLSIGATYQSTRTFQQFADSSYTNDAALWNDFNRSPAYNTAYPVYYRYAGSYFGLTWNIRNRLTFQANVRQDASSRFSAEHSTVVFGSIGLSYQLLRRDTTHDKRKVFNWIKLRATGGTTGSDGMADYLYWSSWKPGTANTAYGGQSILTPQTAYRSDVRWMTLLKLNGGLDCKLFRHVDLTVNYYHNLALNQFISITLPGQTGSGTGTNFDLPVRVRNSGIEWSLRTRLKLTSSLYGTVQWAFTRPWNKLLSAPASLLDLIPGSTLSTRQLFTYLGKDANNNFAMKDYNGDGKITKAADALEIKDREIRYYWSCAFGLERRKSSLHIRLAGINQPQFTPRTQAYVDGYPGSHTNGYLLNRPGAVLDWDGPYSAYQFPSVNPTPEQLKGAQYMTGAGVSLENVFCITIRQIDLRWELPSKLAKKISAKGILLYLQGKDLATLSSYKGGNPTLIDPLGLPVMATVGIGADINF